MLKKSSKNCNEKYVVCQLLGFLLLDEINKYSWHQKRNEISTKICAEKLIEHQKYLSIISIESIEFYVILKV
jgi:hypothetical protein